MTHATRRTIPLLAVSAALLLGACGGDDDTATTEPPPTAEDDTGSAADEAPADDENTIVIADFAFSGVTEVAVGTTVRVTNTDTAEHTWTSVDGAFNSGVLASGDSFEFTFTEAGTFAYLCNIHPTMSGSITVTP